MNTIHVYSIHRLLFIILKINMEFWKSLSNIFIWLGIKMHNLKIWSNFHNVFKMLGIAAVLFFARFLNQSYFHFCFRVSETLPPTGKKNREEVVTCRTHNHAIERTLYLQVILHTDTFLAVWNWLLVSFYEYHYYILIILIYKSDTSASKDIVMISFKFEF